MCFDGGLSAGTGLVSLLMSPLVRKYTVTDTVDLVGLIRKNVKHRFSGWGSNQAAGANLAVESLDWVQLQQCTETQRKTLLSNVSQPIDLVLAVDCIYHPSLISPLLGAINCLATPKHTSALVLSELRSEDVMRLFMEGWLALPGWKVWHVGGDLLQDPHYVLWVGQKE